MVITIGCHYCEHPCKCHWAHEISNTNAFQPWSTIFHSIIIVCYCSLPHSMIIHEQSWQFNTIQYNSSSNHLSSLSINHHCWLIFILLIKPLVIIIHKEWIMIDIPVMNHDQPIVTHALELVAVATNHYMIQPWPTTILNLQLVHVSTMIHRWVHQPPHWPSLPDHLATASPRCPASEANAFAQQVLLDEVLRVGSSLTNKKLVRFPGLLPTGTGWISMVPPKLRIFSWTNRVKMCVFCGSSIFSEKKKKTHNTFWMSPSYVNTPKYQKTSMVISRQEQ